MSSSNIRNQAKMYLLTTVLVKSIRQNLYSACRPVVLKVDQGTFSRICRFLCYIYNRGGAAAAAAAKSLQSCPTLCDSIDGSPPGSPIAGILQARTLEWVLAL